jgi:subtilisin family serine protease
VKAYRSDQIAGLNRVYALRNSFNIAAANMSLGGGNYAGTCDTDPRKPIIDSLRNAGIATVISAGNSGYKNAMGAPACISTSISVGSTTDSDTFASYSNVSASTDVLAPGGGRPGVDPGTQIYSSTNSSNTSYGNKRGTSMAAPHVAGAWAVMKSKNGFASVSSIESALEASGRLIRDTRSGGTHRKPRIDLDGALARISAGPQRGFTWDHCRDIWQSGSTTWCWAEAGGFWISSSNDQTEKVFINGAASDHWVGYNVSASGAITYVRLWRY